MTVSAGYREAAPRAFASRTRRLALVALALIMLALAMAAPAAADPTGEAPLGAVAATPGEPPVTASLLADPVAAIASLMDGEGGDEIAAGAGDGLSPLSMFRAADPLVKGVMLGLLLASLATWTVALAKTLEFAGARRRAGGALALIRSARTLEQAAALLAGRRGPAAAMVRAAAEEAALSNPAIDQAGGAGLKERVASVLGRIEALAGRRMARGGGLLATIGATAPFVGLFGTVWGIMNAFIGIARSGTTSLAVVAPGIAEALLATAIGLFAAIPAVVIYNILARRLAAYRALLADAAASVERLVSRDLDFRMARERPPVVGRPRLSLSDAAE